MSGRVLNTPLVQFKLTDLKTQMNLNISLKALLYLISICSFLYLADCSASTRYDVMSTCVDFPLHHYQDQTAQSRCMPYPKDFVTEAEKAVSIHQSNVSGQDIH